MFSAEAVDSFTQFCHIYKNTKNALQDTDDDGTPPNV